MVWQTRGRILTAANIYMNKKYPIDTHTAHSTHIYVKQYNNVEYIVVKICEYISTFLFDSRVKISRLTNNKRSKMLT